MTVVATIGHVRMLIATGTLLEGTASYWPERIQEEDSR